jgi:hypothetical protein
MPAGARATRQLRLPQSAFLLALTPLSTDEQVRSLAWDAAAYRALARAADGDVEAVRAAALAAAASDRAAGWTPVASPYALWPLLAESLEPEPDEDAPKAKTPRKKAAMSAEAASAPARRAALARLAIVACVTHCAPPTDSDAKAAVIDWDDEVAARAAPVVPMPTMIEDPESILVQLAGGKVPKDHAAFNLYLASTAADLAADPTAARARRLAGPLDHVRERATLIEGDFADEMQDAIVGAYEAAADAWDDSVSVAERQRQVAKGAALLERAVLDGRATRAESLGGANPSASAPRIQERCAAGLALWREVVGAVVRSEIELEGSAWRRTLWGLQLAFPVGVMPLAVVSGDPVLLDAARRAKLGDRIRAAAT